MGLRLRWVGDGTDRLSWRDIIVLIRHPHSESAFTTEVTNGEARWGIQEQLQAALFDSIRGIMWQNSGGKGPRPKPLPRPGLQTQTATSPGPNGPQGDPFNPNESGVFRGETMPIDELNKWLGWA